MREAAVGARTPDARTYTADGSGPSWFPLGATDRLVLLYNCAAAIVLLASASRVRSWQWLLLLHAVTAGVVLVLARRTSGRHAAMWDHLRFWYPFAVIVLFYQEAGMLRHLVVGADLDPEVAALEVRVFGRRWYETLATGMNLPCLEAWHGLYWSYYALLLVPAAVARALGRPRVHRYVFVVVLTFVAHFAIYMVLPVSGPAALRAGLIPPGVLFIPVMNAIHDVGTRGGLAMPSLHVAAALVAAVFGSRWFPRWRATFGAWFGLIAASSGVCCYHYILDVAAGLVSGAICLALGTHLWQRHGPAEPPPGGGPVRDLPVD